MSETTPPANNKSNKKTVKKPRLVTWDRLPTDETPQPGQAINWDTRTGKGKGLLRRIEYWALLAKEPINKVVGTTQLNPLYYSGTIAFFLLVVVIITGVYVLMFYQYGNDVSYASVESMERFFVSRAARVIHRYASGGLMIFGVLHAIRMFFMDRFRGPRWLAWAAGVVTMLLLWLAGITGYWLIWDQGAQLITYGFLNLLNLSPAMASGFYTTFLTDTGAEQNSWLLMFIIMIVHLLLTAIVGLFYWYHIKRLKRPKFLPPRYWLVGMGLLLVIAGLFFPAGMLPRADFSVIPSVTPLDPIFLFYLPPSLGNSLWAVGILLIVLAITAVITAIPWMFPRQKLDPVAITPERCTGCKHCAEDCPYGALKMVERNDDTPFALLAEVDKNLCVSCGICVGSCDTLAISLGENKPEQLWQDVATRLSHAKKKTEQPVKVIFTCERHAAHSAHTYVHSAGEDATATKDTLVEVVPVTCVAMVNPGLITHALESGADEIQVVGCPPNDCTNREGNVWVEERLSRTRAPKLKPSYKDAPIFTTWLAPDHFEEAIPLRASTNGTNSALSDEQHPPTTYQQIMAAFNRRNLILAVILLTVGLLLQVRLTYTAYTPASDAQAAIQVVAGQNDSSGAPLQITLKVDGQTVLNSEPAPVYKQIPASTGQQHILVTATTAGGQEPSILADETVTIESGQIYQLILE